MTYPESRPPAAWPRLQLLGQRGLDSWRVWFRDFSYGFTLLPVLAEKLPRKAWRRMSSAQGSFHEFAQRE